MMVTSMLKMTSSTELDVLDIMEPTDVFAVSGPTASVRDNDLLNVWLAMQHDPTVGHLLEVIQGLREERAIVEELEHKNKVLDDELNAMEEEVNMLEEEIEDLRLRLYRQINGPDDDV